MWGGKGTEAQERWDICLIMACIVVHQKPTRHCKPVFLQLKNKFKNKYFKKKENAYVN